MPVSKTMARMAQKKFLHKYYDPEYVNGVGISLVGVCDGEVLGDERRDYCIVVRLRKALSENIIIPSKIDGVRVYARVVGGIRPRSL